MALGNFLKNGTYSNAYTGMYEPHVRQGPNTDGQDYIADWDDYFAPSVMDAAGNNLQKICYEYLKSLPYFSGCTDV